MREFLVKYPEIILKIIKRNLFLTKIIIAVITSALVFLGIFQTSKVYTRSKKELKIGFAGRVLYLNPVIQTANPIELKINSLLYDPLVEPNINGDILPLLAKTWTLSQEGKSYTFFLRKNLKWHNGDILTSYDVYTTLKKIKESKQKTALVEALNDVEFKIIDDLTLEFKLKQTNSTFLELLNIPIASNKYLKEYSYAKLLEEPEIYTPIGTGPYILTTKKLDKLLLVKNRNYFRGPPKIPRIQISFYEKPFRVELAYINDEINMFDSYDPQVFFRFRKQPNTSIDTYTLAFETKVLLFNLKKKNSVSTNLSFRKALLHLINKESLIDNYPGAKIAYGPYSELSWAFNPIVYNYKFNQELGLNFLDECKKSLNNKCLEFTLTYAKSTQNQLIATRVKNLLKKYKINVILKPVSLDELLQEIIPTRDFEVLLIGIQTTIDPDQYNLWHSSAAKYPGLNISGLSSKRIDFFLEQGRIATDKLKRKKLYFSFQEQLFKIVPVVYLYNPPLYVVRRTYIKPSLNNQLITSPLQIYRSIYNWEIKNSSSK